MLAVVEDDEETMLVIGVPDAASAATSCVPAWIVAMILVGLGGRELRRYWDRRTDPPP